MSFKVAPTKADEVENGQASLSNEKLYKKTQKNKNDIMTREEQRSKGVFGHDLMDVFVKVSYGNSKMQRTETLHNAGCNHFVTASQVTGQTIHISATELGNGQVDISLFDDDGNTHEKIGCYKGNLIEIMEEDKDYCKILDKFQDEQKHTHVKVRLRCIWGHNNIFAGYVEVMLSQNNFGGLDMAFKKFIGLRDVATVMDLREMVDKVPLYGALISLFMYYLIGLIFYSQFPKSLRGNLTQEEISYSCMNGSLMEMVAVPYITVSHTDDLLASCDQSLNNDSIVTCSGFVDAFYFITATLTTVGYGDMSPAYSGAGGLFFALVFALVGVSFIGTSLGIVSGLVMDLEDASIERLRIEGGSKSTKHVNCVKRNCSCCYSQNGTAIFKAFGAIFTTLTVGMIFYYLELTQGQGLTSEELALNSENMFVKVLYYATITSTTIGYGDEAPLTIAGRFFGSLYMLLAVSTFGYAISALADIPLSRRRRKLERNVVTQYGSSLSPVELSNILRSANPNATTDVHASCDKASFVVAMLIQLNKIKYSQIKHMEDQFHRLDHDRSGTLTIADVTEEIEHEAVFNVDYD